LIKILITGAPTIGKTSLAKRLAENLGYKYVADKEILPVGSYEEITFQGSLLKEVDVEKLNLKDDSFDDNTVFEGLLFPETDLDFDVIFMLYLSEDELRKRLTARGYSDAKIEDNVFSQNSGYLRDLSEKICETVFILQRQSLSEDLKVIEDILQDISK